MIGPLTDEVKCFLEVGTDVGCVAVLHRDPLVVIQAFGWLRVPSGDVEQGCDASLGQVVVPGGMVGTAEVEERGELHRRALQQHTIKKGEENVSAKSFRTI